MPRWLDRFCMMVAGAGLGIIVALAMLLTGCATLKPPMTAPDTVRDECKAVADAPIPTWKKAAIWASNIIVVPLTAPTILIGGPVFVYPDEDWSKKYETCMRQAGYGR